MSVPRHLHAGAPVIVPRLGDADVVAIIAALEARARVYLVSADMVGDANAELARRDRAAAQACRDLAARLDRLRQLMRARR